MKKMLLNKKNLYIKLTAVLILLIVGILGIYTAFVQKIATGQCFNILDDSRERMGQMIVNEMQNEQDHLEADSYLLKNLLTDYKLLQYNHNQVLNRLIQVLLNLQILFLRS